MEDAGVEGGEGQKQTPAPTGAAGAGAPGQTPAVQVPGQAAPVPGQEVSSTEVASTSPEAAPNQKELEHAAALTEGVLAKLGINVPNSDAAVVPPAAAANAGAASTVDLNAAAPAQANVDNNAPVQEKMYDIDGVTGTDKVKHKYKNLDEVNADRILKGYEPLAGLKTGGRRRSTRRRPKKSSKKSRRKSKKGGKKHRKSTSKKSGKSKKRSHRKKH